jgi:mannose/fructose/N-acetylgalactosamine-specific phosphotransferase system component IIC
MIPSMVVSVLAGSVLWLDRVFLFQLMLSRPIVISPVVGLIMGNVSVGLMVGAALELLWLNAPPVGAYLPEDESFCAAAATPAAVLVSAHLSDASAAGLALLLGLPFAMVGRMLDTRLRTLNQHLLKDKPDEDPGIVIGRALAKALARSFLYVLAALGLSVALLGAAAILVAGVLPGAVQNALAFMPLAAVALGLAGLVTKDIPRPGQTGLFILGMILILMVSWIL